VRNRPCLLFSHSAFSLCRRAGTCRRVNASDNTTGTTGKRAPGSPHSAGVAPLRGLVSARRPVGAHSTPVRRQPAQSAGRGAAPRAHTAARGVATAGSTARARSHSGLRMGPCGAWEEVGRGGSSPPRHTTGRRRQACGAHARPTTRAALPMQRAGQRAGRKGAGCAKKRSPPAGRPAGRQRRGGT
jgi:hypothetical protein